MPNVFRSSFLSGALFALLVALTGAAAQGQTSAITSQLSHVDIGVGAAGELTNSVTGTNYLGTTLVQSPSNTVGVVVQVRYTRSPYLGLEFNYGYARYTQNFSSYIIGGAQTNANEYTLGYVAHTPDLFGLHTVVSGGLGTTAFKGTPHGGQGLPEQARMTYYYSAGVEKPLTEHFGIRAQFRQLFFLAPDFGQNYLTIKKRQITTEPGIGFYVHF